MYIISYDSFSSALIFIRELQYMGGVARSFLVICVCFGRLVDHLEDLDGLLEMLLANKYSI